jgi:hypothetical protein
MEMVLQLLESGEIKGFAFRIANPSIIAAVEDWHKAKRDARVRTHSAECWRWHQECAEYRIEKLSAQVQAVRDAIEAELERHTLTNLGDFMFLDQALGRILRALDGDNDA